MSNSSSSNNNNKDVQMDDVAEGPSSVSLIQPISCFASRMPSLLCDGDDNKKTPAGPLEQVLRNHRKNRHPTKNTQDKQNGRGACSRKAGDHWHTPRNKFLTEPNSVPTNIHGVAPRPRAHSRRLGLQARPSSQCCCRRRLGLRFNGLRANRSRCLCEVTRGMWGVIVLAL